MARKLSAVPESSSGVLARSRARYVETILRDRILSGHYKPDSRLPTEREISDELHAHRKTVRRAIQQMEREKLIVRKPNCRPVVCSNAELLVRSSAGELLPDAGASRFVALVMRGGALLESRVTSQQRIFWGLNQVLSSAGLNTVFLDSKKPLSPTNKPEQVELDYLNYALKKRFAGIVLFTCAWEGNHDAIRRISREIPIILIDRKIDAVDLDFVGISNFRATYDATSLLIERNHSRIAFLTRLEGIYPISQRTDGYLCALADRLGSNYFEMVMHVPSRDGVAWSSFDAAFERPPETRPTAIMCVNDFEAFRAAQRLSEMGLRIPQDVSIVGFDDVVPVLPNGLGLSTIMQPFEQIGEEAGKLFLRRRADPGIPHKTVICPTELLLRDSVATL